MLKNQDKILELVEFLVKTPGVSYLIYENTDYKAFKQPEEFDNLLMITYQFCVHDIEITYNKWFMEEFELAQKMDLPGCEHHNQLVKGTGVLVLSKKLGAFNFYGDRAKNIINACEENLDLQAHIIKIKKENQK